jgi:predicted kinase
MKQKVLKKPTLVLMAGLPGVGKTTLAFELGQRLGLGWVVLEKDRLKESFLEAPPLKGNFDEYTAGWEAYESIFTAAEDFLVNQQLSVILDTSLLHPFILERARKLIARSGAQLKIILCEVDERTRQYRLRTRKTRISQAKAHLLPKEAAKQFDQLDPSSYKKIRTKCPLKTYINEAFTYVTEPEQEAARYQSVSSEVNHFGTLMFFFTPQFVFYTHMLFFHSTSIQ